MKSNETTPESPSLLHRPLSFSSEALLQQAIAGLLIKMPEVTGVQILQGSQELGKDIIFYIRGGFNESILCACVVKNSKISGDVGKPTGARTILFQAEQAFDSVHTNSMGEDTKVERVYVITPFDLPPTTITSISGRLKERAGQVKFIGGSSLFDLFKRYWPDYFADEAAVIEQHLKATKNIFVDDSPLPALAFQYALGSVSVKSMNVYVAQKFHREISGYTKGSILTLPDSQSLLGSLTQEALTNIKASLSGFDSALAYLTEWGLTPPYDERNLQQPFEKFIEELQEEWQNDTILDRKMRSGIQRAAGQDLETATTLRDPTVLIASLRRLVSERYGYLKPFERALTTLNNLIQSGDLAGVGTLADTTFINACLINDCARAAPQKLFFHTNVQKRLDLPKDVLDKWGKHLLIAGSPGYGKTSFCRWHALQDAENINLRRSNVFPIYVPLHQLARRPLGSFEETFLQTAGRSALATSAAGGPSRMRLYLDGLDEIASPTRRREVVELVREGVARDPNYQVVMTTRDYVLGEWLEWLPKVYLSEFDDSEISLFLDKWLGRNSEINKRFCGQLANVPALRTLMRTPLLATLTIMVFKQTGRLPESKNRLYEIFIDLLAGGWDVAKGVNRGSKYGQKLKVLILTSLAGKLHLERHREFDERTLKSVIESSLSRDLLSHSESLQNELIRDGIINQSGGVLHFSHLSFQEFLAAKSFMGTPHHSRVLRALELYLYGDNWWRDVLKYYVGLASSPQAVATWLAQQIQHFKNLNYQPISITHAHEILTGVVEAFPEYPVAQIASTVRGTLSYKATYSVLEQFRENMNKGSSDS